MAAKSPSEADRVEALRRVLSGLVAGVEVSVLADSVAELHPRRNTFPGEVFMALGAEALDLASVTPDDPIRYEGLVETFLADYQIQNRNRRKIAYAVLTAAALRAGIEPDLFDDAAWWQTDDYWRWSLLGAVALIRACAHKRDLPVETMAGQLADRLGVDL